ncbi:hypothetical protein HRE53_27910 (plasmid) [Acaryochloris sp. 'Moss Beach']|uniref:hypothetical protein n=1 Tax=Acaryochloris sp. 'Moss Beach' TaxID=2740837 RepID=UPI001F31C813|nr:hypothetical protein [Acaryochloris sp. 'Moss Beach']UJB72650.1 hypothetical protein HRE53_27910 [Acaryochloris sp. 'Moss Beach']
MDEALDALSQQLKVGDVVEISIIDRDFFPGQTIEIPIACKHLTKYNLFLYFHPHRLNLEFIGIGDDTDNEWLALVIDHLEIADFRRGYIATYDEEKSWSNQLVAWEKIGSSADPI